MELHNIRKNQTGVAAFGCMWKRGELLPDDLDHEVICVGSRGNIVPMQSRITAYWPDASVKWTAHLADAQQLGRTINVCKKEGVFGEHTAGEGTQRQNVIAEHSENRYITGTGIDVVINKKSGNLFEKVTADGRTVMENGKAVLYLENISEENGDRVKRIFAYDGRIENITIEEQGEIQTIVKYEGIHVCSHGIRAGEKKIPFVIRMIVQKTVGTIRFMHTFLYDGDENHDYLKGIGIQFDYPLTGTLYNRHIKVTTDYGVWHEAGVPALSWHPRIPEEIYGTQMAGRNIWAEAAEETRQLLRQVLKDTPHWDTYSICQDSSSHFRIRKKVADENCCYIDCLHGQQSDGGIAFGSEGGSILIAMQDFWEKYPSGYQVRGMSGDKATVNLWIYSPEAECFDFRHYANRGYNQVCYEGYDYKGANPDGIACTNECTIGFCRDIIPGDEQLRKFTAYANRPPLYVADPESYHELRAFGYWSLERKATAMERWLEKQLEEAFLFYRDEVKQRGWYGIFNYGDFMHSYDRQRHQWKYDIGGYAWDNTELVPTLWLWLYFLRTGREDVFDLAQKLSRHASEVDVYHAGIYKGLGSRHNVRHWGCPCKEARIAMAAHHRVMYYLTGDRRLEDIFEELKDNELSFKNRDPLGDFYPKDEMVYASHARSGPDWSSLCANWMTEWERKDDARYRDKIITGILDIASAPLKLSSGPDFEFDPDTVHLRYIGEKTTGGCHLQVCMGAPGIWMEMADLLADEPFRRMIADYGRFAFLPREQQLAESEGIIGDREYAFPFMFAAMGAYAAAYFADGSLARKVWRTLLATMIDREEQRGFQTQIVKNQGNREALREIPWITTNFTAQWCLNVIMTLDFIREELPYDLQEAVKWIGNTGDGFLHRA